MLNGCHFLAPWVFYRPDLKLAENHKNHNSLKTIDTNVMKFHILNIKHKYFIAICKVTHADPR